MVKKTKKKCLTLCLACSTKYEKVPTIYFMLYSYLSLLIIDAALIYSELADYMEPRSG